MSNLISMSEMIAYYTPALKQCLIDLGKIAQTMNIVEMVTPVNAGEEKRKWLELAAHGEWTNPKFQYNTELLASVANHGKQLKDLNTSLDAIRTTLSNEQAGRVLRELTMSRCEEIESTINLAQAILVGDDCAVNNELKMIFGDPSEKAVDAAHKSAINGVSKDQQDNSNLKIVRQRLGELEFDAEMIRENFVWMADQCGFADTRPVEVNKLTTSIDVRDKSSRGAVVTIPADRKVSGMKLVELTGHEVLCHWADSERVAKILPLLGSGALKPADEVLYEGHATLTDYHTHFNLGDKAPQQQAPFYVVAMERARHGATFAEVADYIYYPIRKTKSTDEAALLQTWTTCFRVFRGSKGGGDNQDVCYAFTKDRAYFEGRLIAEELHAQKMDSILELGTLRKDDIDILKTAVQFEEKDTDQARMMLLLWGMVQRLLDGKF